MNDLVTIARRINDREKTIGMLKRQLLDKGSEALREVLLQGDDLLKVKASIKHGQWLYWLGANTTISERTAQDYMRLASHPQRAADFIAAGSIRQALALLEDRDEPIAKKQAKQWPPYLEASGRLSKLIGYVERFPLEQWPDEGLEKFKEDLQPIAAKLWPDKFP